MTWTTRGVDPLTVTSDHLRSYGERLEASGMRLRPRQTILTTAYNWNDAAERFPEFWPQARLIVEYRDKVHYSLPWSDFAPSLYEEVQRRTAAVLDPDLLDPDAHDAVCERTAHANAYDIRRFASALALQTGRDPKSITSIGDLIKIDAAAAILDFLRARLRRKNPDAKRSSGLHLAGQLLCNLARNWVKVDEHHLKVLRKWAGHLDPRGRRGQRKRRHRGMTEKNRTTVGEFRDEQKVARFLDLPEATFDRILRRRHLRRIDAVKLSCAFAVALLQIAPVRPKNGSGIELGRNLIERGTGASRRVFAHWAPEEVKNGVELEFELTGLTLQLFDLYMKHARPRLCGPENRYLFPGRGTGPKDSSWFSTQIAQFLNAEIGLRVTGQQFRHVIGYLYLVDHPGDYETVRQFLGHSNIRTTLEFYAGQEMQDAAKALDAAIGKRRAELAGTARHAPRNRRRLT